MARNWLLTGTVLPFLAAGTVGPAGAAGPLPTAVAQADIGGQFRPGRAVQPGGAPQPGGGPLRPAPGGFGRAPEIQRPAVAVPRVGEPAPRIQPAFPRQPAGLPDVTRRRAVPEVPVVRPLPGEAPAARRQPLPVPGDAEPTLPRTGRRLPAMPDGDRPELGRPALAVPARPKRGPGQVPVAPGRAPAPVDGGASAPTGLPHPTTPDATPDKGRRTHRPNGAPAQVRPPAVVPGGQLPASAGDAAPTGKRAPTPVPGRKPDDGVADRPTPGLGARPPTPPAEAGAVPGRPRDTRAGRRDAGVAAVGVAAGFVGGFLAAQGVSRLEDVRSRRQEFSRDGVDIVREPGRTIIRQNNRIFVAHDENERFRELGYDVRSERDGDDDVAVFTTPDGSRILTTTDAQGRLVRRLRRFPDGHQVYLIDNRYRGPDRDFTADIVELPPLAAPLPLEQYVVGAEGASEGVLYDALEAPPVAALPRRYTLDQVRYSPDLRARMRSVDLSAVTFATGSWTVTLDQVGRLSAIAQAINRAVRTTPQEIFMVEGYTDAVGNPVDNLSLSDRRAQAVAAVLSETYRVPPENLVTQGYGEQFPRLATQGPSAENRRVTVRRITPLLTQGGDAP